MGGKPCNDESSKEIKFFMVFNHLKLRFKNANIRKTQMKLKRVSTGGMSLGKSLC